MHSKPFTGCVISQAHCCVLMKVSIIGVLASSTSTPGSLFTTSSRVSLKEVPASLLGSSQALGKDGPD